ncbi:MAG: WecB/TagA/CpsF family glycosyltransferase [Candidatus Roizmanbacteria bacterium]|nr:WecB/TagA/CpsF family glycosyltransferase [Candidatus Roizmanbacteria bacterium]
MTELTAFGAKLNFADYNDILESIQKGYSQRSGMQHIVSLNPETVMMALENKSFMEAVRTAHFVIADGIGVVVAIQTLFGVRVPRVTGVDLMEKLLRANYRNSLTVCLIGGKGKVADKVRECYGSNQNGLGITAVEGYNDIFNQKKSETDAIFSIVSLLKPRLVFVAFGSPQQELWIERHRELFKNAVVIGVGGAFDFLSGVTPRAPHFLRKIGMEWLFRLVMQPWRIKRQMKLLVFFVYVLIYKMRQLLTFGRE